MIAEEVPVESIQAEERLVPRQWVVHWPPARAEETFC
jgi:hypothetical protein